MKVFYFYSDSPERASFFARSKGALSQPDAGTHSFLYGADVLEKKGHKVTHNLSGPPGRSGGLHFFCEGLWHLANLLGAQAGDFFGVYKHLRQAQSADLMISTSDRMGVPLLYRQGLFGLRRPWVYISIGLPERMQRTPKIWQAFYRRALVKIPAVITYGHAEAEWIKQWIKPGRTTTHFIPFGVLPPATAARSKEPDIDILGVGADPQRDWQVLIDYARTHPERNVRLVLSATAAALLKELPDNVDLQCEIPLEQVTAIMQRSRLVALPVKENTYSGATTTLLQAMSLACPVVVSRVGAIRDGYGLEDGVNACLPEPGNPQAFHQAIDYLLDHPHDAEAMGAAARRHVMEHLTWDHYVDRLEQVLMTLHSAEPQATNAS